VENQQRANIAMLETIRSTLSLRAVTRRPLTRRLILCGTALAMLIFPSLLGAQTVDSAKLLRFDVSALVGYRTSISFSSQPSSGEVSSNLLLDPSLSYGIAFGARIDEDNLVEFRWARQKTHLHTGSTVSIPFSEAAMLDQFHLDFTHEYAIEGWPVGARPFVMGSVGASRISNASNGSFVRFSMGLGGGIKFFLNRHFGVRVQAQWLPLFVDPEVVSFVCGGGCVVHLNAGLSSQGEVAIGPIFRF